ncbi:MAG: EAL domain-containing protein [Terracidiphilus sp.]|nr:EAL domain-containing protein [Terracidiphilus sp.]MDR3777106.1 EAL domain-containing protein [Terracidiphilus sp.]
MLKAEKRKLDQPLLGLVFAVAVVIAAFLVRQVVVLGLGIDLPPFITFYPAVMIVAVLAGRWPGLLATVLATLLTEFWVISPVGQFKIERTSGVISLLIFFAMCVVTSLLSERYRQDERRLAALRSEQELNETRSKLEAALASMTDAVFISDTDGRFIDFNDAFATFHRFRSKADCSKAHDEYPEILDIRTPDGEPLPPNMWAVPRALRGETACNVEYTVRRKDTGETWIGSYSFSPIIDKDGAIAGAVVTARDITAQKQAEHALRASETRYRTAFLTTPDCVNINRFVDGVYVDVNDGFCRITGYKPEEVLGRTSRDINIWADPSDRDRFIEALRQNSECRDFETRFRAKDGSFFWGLVSSSLVELDGVRCHLSITRDITAAKLAEEEIRNLANFDPLTGLANRRQLMERLQKSMVGRMRTRGKRALLIIDLDNFKALNDTLGHHTGDLVLCEIARRISDCAREGDIVARPGGDEFVVMLDNLSEAPEAAASQAKDAAQKILAQVSLPCSLDNYVYSGACSIGITVFGNDQGDMNEVLQQADIAMYKAKAAGRNTARFFAPALQAAVNARAVMEEDLRQGLKAIQFQLYYQPQVEGGRVIGAEVLIRWNHPRHGLLYPGAFIALAEETRLILPLGDWVLDSACRQIATWSKQTQTAALTVSVNISALQLRLPDFAEQVLETIERTGANPKNLELEITETMLVEDAEDIIVKMTALKAHGVRFSIDDFGTGYSSLAYLKRLPLDQLKIDQSFVRDILTDASSSTIAQVIVNLSKAMNMSVIAEGVETEEQRDFLAHIGCKSYQGYLFSRPIPLHEFERLLPS